MRNITKRLETVVEFDDNRYIVSSSVDGRNRAHTALFECDNCGNVKGEVPIFATLDKDPGRLVENHIATIVNIDHAIIGAPVVTRKPIEPAETSAPETTDPKIEKGNLVAVLPEFLKEYQGVVCSVCKRPFPATTIGMIVNVENGMADVSWMPFGFFDVVPAMRINVQWLHKLCD